MMNSKLSSAITEALSASLGEDTGFITSSVVAWVAMDENGQHRMIVLYDGSLLEAAKLSEFATMSLDNIIESSLNGGTG